MTPPDRFLYLARFLEAYHRRDSGLRDHQFAKRATALLSGPAAQPARRAFGAPAADLARVVKDTRNYYVHYDPQIRTNARHDIPLDDLADRVWCVVRSVLWSDFGMPAATIERILEDRLALHASDQEAVVRSRARRASAPCCDRASPTRTTGT